MFTYKAMISLQTGKYCIVLRAVTMSFMVLIFKNHLSNHLSIYMLVDLVSISHVSAGVFVVLCVLCGGGGGGGGEEGVGTL